MQSNTDKNVLIIGTDYLEVPVYMKKYIENINKNAKDIHLTVWASDL